MSNDKVAATTHGRQQVQEVMRAYANGYAHGGHRETTNIRDWELAQEWVNHGDDLAVAESVVDRETTGEHVWGKLQDDPYAAIKAAGVSSKELADAWPFELKRDPLGVVAPDPMRPLQHGDSLTERWKELTSDERYAEQAERSKIDWTPTPSQILMSFGIVVAIIVIFCFIVVAY